jgi:tripartite-type tricarboxylate transporter receptor subunit TctC
LILKRAGAALAMAAVLACGATCALAQAWPNRPVTIVTPFAAGSITDVAGRLLAQQLQQALGQPFVVDNKAGAGGLIAAQYVARANPDGYTLLLTTNSTHSAAAALFKTVPYDPIKDFTAIARIGSFPSVFSVNPKLPINSMKELIAYGKAHPGALTYGYGNSTGYIAGESIRHKTGLDIVKVAYRSVPNAMTDLIGGQISAAIPDMSNALPQIAQKTIRPLAVLTKARNGNLPDVPTLDETVMPGFDLIAWAGLFGPARLPADVVAKLEAETKAALSSQAVLANFRTSGIEPFWTNSADFQTYVGTEMTKWTTTAAEAGIEPE